MRKRILILGHNYATQFVDIYNQYTCLFPTDQYEVTVAYLTGEPDEAVKKRTIADHTLFLNLPKAKIRYLKIGAIRQLLAICREKKFTMVICHRYKPTYLMLWVAQFCAIPALFFVMHELGTMQSRGRQLLIAALTRKNMVYAGVSNAVRDDMRKSLWGVPTAQIVTLYNMIDIDLTEPQLLSREEARNALQLNANDFVFGNVARLVKNKDQATLIRAFAQIKPDCPQAKLLLLGEGALADELRQQVNKLGLENDVIFTGFLPNGFSYMKAFDCFVLSSVQEAFGRVLLEAMIARLPIIATKVHGIPEVVAHAGVLVEARDKDTFAKMMQMVYQMPLAERKNKGETAYEHVLQHFSIPQFDKQFWQLPLAQITKV